MIDAQFVGAVSANGESAKESLSEGFSTMTEHGPRMKGAGRSFRDCVQDCACDDQMVAAYNELYGTQLKAPILALLQHQQGAPGPNPDTQEGAELARFIFFCYDTVWRHVRRARQRTTWPIRVTGRRSSDTSGEAEEIKQEEDGSPMAPWRGARLRHP